MSEQLPKEEKFIPHADSGHGDVEFKKGRLPTVVEIFDKGNCNSVFMYVDEARALRDWLNKVLP